MCELHTKIDNVMNARCWEMTSPPQDGSCATLCVPLIRKRGHLWRHTWPLTRDRCRYITIGLMYSLVIETLIFAATTSRPWYTDASSHEESIESCWLLNPAKGRRDNVNKNASSSSYKENHWSRQTNLRYLALLKTSPFIRNLIYQYEPPCLIHQRI